MILVSIKKKSDKEISQYISGCGGLGKSLSATLSDFVFVATRTFMKIRNSEIHINLFLTIRICPVRAPNCEYGMQLSLVHTNGNLATEITSVMPVLGRRTERPITSVHRNSKKKSSLSIQTICEIIHFV
jgi:hypothetical protein